VDSSTLWVTVESNGIGWTPIPGWSPLSPVEAIPMESDGFLAGSLLALMESNKVLVGSNGVLVGSSLTPIELVGLQWTPVDSDGVCWSPSWNGWPSVKFWHFPLHCLLL
jgi:hypothetical protein